MIYRFIPTLLYLCYIDSSHKEGIPLLKKAGNLFTTAYLLLIFGIYPFYMREGYVDIGKAKYQFFIRCSLGALAILVLIGFLYAVWRLYCRIKYKQLPLIDWSRLSAVDLFVILYATEIFISYSYSDYRDEALWGTEGWYIGLVLLLTLCGLYFFISRFWIDGKLVLYVEMTASGLVFLLGILDRFSLYLLPIEIRQPSFISTLGNINWFCGCLSVLAPPGICLFLLGTEKKLWYGIYALVVFAAGFCQGGSSIFLFFAALFYALLWIALRRREWMLNFFLLLFLWGFSAQLIRLIRVLIPQGYNYDVDNLCAYMTGSGVTLWIALFALGIFIFLQLRWKGTLNEGTQRFLRRIMLLLPLVIIFCWATLAMICTRTGIPGLAQAEWLQLGKTWGNGRGAAIYSSLQMYGQMPMFHKFFGVGPDCFSAYAYSLPEVAKELRDFFGASRLTNAHSELLTALVNTGILGVCFFIGIFASFIAKCRKEKLRDPAFYLFAVPVVCYFIHNMVSFAQVLNLPFLFLLLGMGEAKRRAFTFAPATDTCKSRI